MKIDSVAVKQKINAIFIKQFRLSEQDLVPTLSLEYDLFVDSLDITEIMMNLEEQFDLPITDEHVAEMKTLGDIYNFVLYGMELNNQNLPDDEMIELLYKRLIKK